MAKAAAKEKAKAKKPAEGAKSPKKKRELSPAQKAQIEKMNAARKGKASPPEAPPSDLEGPQGLAVPPGPPDPLPVDEGALEAALASVGVTIPADTPPEVRADLAKSVAKSKRVVKAAQDEMDAAQKAGLEMLKKAERNLTARSFEIEFSKPWTAIADLTTKFLGKYDDFGIRFWLPTGVSLLDLAIGFQGYPAGKVTELYGRPGSAKTWHALRAVAMCQKLGGVGVWLDAEAALSKSLATKLAGVDIYRNFIYRRPKSAEQCLDYLTKMIPKLSAVGLPAVVVVDSMAALCPKDIVDPDFKFEDTPPIAKMARLASIWFSRAIRDIADGSNVVVILINQTRASPSMGRTKGPPQPDRSTPGGIAAEYYASVRIELTRYEMDMPESERKAGMPPAGCIVSAWVAKNRVGPPFRKALYPFYFRDDQPALGVDDGIACLTYLYARKYLPFLVEEDPKTGQMKTSTTKYTFGPWAGTKRAFMKLVLTDEEFRQEVIGAAREVYKEQVGTADLMDSLEDEGED